MHIFCNPLVNNIDTCDHIHESYKMLGRKERFTVTVCVCVLLIFDLMWPGANGHFVSTGPLACSI